MVRTKVMTVMRRYTRNTKKRKKLDKRNVREVPKQIFVNLFKMKSYIKVHKQKFKKKYTKTTKIQVQAYNIIQ